MTAFINEMTGMGVHVDVVHYTRLIDALCKKGKCQEANSLLEYDSQRCGT